MILPLIKVFGNEANKKRAIALSQQLTCIIDESVEVEKHFSSKKI